MRHRPSPSAHLPIPKVGSGDTVVYAGDASDFDVSYNAATGAFTITDRDTADGLDEGTDTVTGVERFSFDWRGNRRHGLP